MQNDEKRIAVFIDFENVAMGVRESKYGNFDIDLVLKRLVEKGKIMVKRAYSDWHRYSEFKRAFHQAAIELIDVPQTRYSGKNSADIRMVVDALDLSYQKEHIDTFVLVSGDSDFSPLVSKLRENGRYVIGMGVKQSSSDLLVNNCDEFIYYEDLVRPPAGHAADPRLLNLPVKKAEAMRLVIETFEALQREGKESIYGSMIKQTLIRKVPSFNESYYGYPTFSRLLEDAAENKLLKLTKDQKSGGYIVTGISDASSQPTSGSINGEGTSEVAAAGETLAAQPALAGTPAITAIRSPRRSRWGRSRPIPGVLRPSPSSQTLREVPLQQESTATEGGPAVSTSGSAEEAQPSIGGGATGVSSATSADILSLGSQGDNPIAATTEQVQGEAEAIEAAHRGDPVAHDSYTSQSEPVDQQTPRFAEDVAGKSGITEMEANSKARELSGAEERAESTVSDSSFEAQAEAAPRQRPRRSARPRARGKTPSGKPRKKQ